MSQATHNPAKARTSPPLSGVALEIAQLLRAENADPFHVLGPHLVERDAARRVVVRVLQPHAAEVAILIGSSVIHAERTQRDGLFEALLPAGISERPGPRDYSISICGAYWLRFDGDRVSGRIRDAGKEEAMRVEQLLKLVGKR